MTERPLIGVEGISRRYPSASGGPDQIVFENVYMPIQRGEFVCLIGHSGCGKTTILNILAGLDQAGDDRGTWRARLLAAQGRCTRGDDEQSRSGDEREEAAHGAG